jgi:hypothetical protein
LCCVDIRTSGSLKKSSVVSPKPERLVGFDSLGAEWTDEIERWLWFKLWESSRIALAFPSLYGGDDCIVKVSYGLRSRRVVDRVSRGG